MEINPNGATTPSSKEIRKELWEYLKAEGFDLTPDRHDKIHEIIDRYVELKAGVLIKDLTQATEKLAGRRAASRAKSQPVS